MHEVQAKNCKVFWLTDVCSCVVRALYGSLIPSDCQSVSLSSNLPHYIKHVFMYWYYDKNKVQRFKFHLVQPLSRKTLPCHSPLCSCMFLECHSDPMMGQW